jgi:hypothetical protein
MQEKKLFVRMLPKILSDNICTLYIPSTTKGMDDGVIRVCMLMPMR